MLNIGNKASRLALAFTTSLLMMNGQAVSQQQSPYPRTIIVMDGSGSMWGQIEGIAKLEIARQTVGDVLRNVPANMELGLLSYGHRRKGDCGDIELVVPPAANSSSQILSAVNSMRFLGKTPLSAAVRQAAESLRYTEDQASVVLITDGIETCSADPCALGNELAQAGLDFKVHVVGFGLSADEGRQVSCLAENTGGMYLQASDAEGLADALNQTILVAQSEPTPVGSVSFLVDIVYADGTSRPSEVLISARNLDTGETLELGRLVDARQVVDGLRTELSPGRWQIDAVGPVGSGSVETLISSSTRQVDIVFGAAQEQFSLMDLGPYQLGQNHMFLLKNNTPLQDNATYSVNLFPAGATDFDQRLDFTYKFGNEVDGYSAHTLDSPAAAGDYEIIIMQGGYNLDEALERFPVTYVTTAALGWEAPSFNMPGEVFSFKVFGQLYRLNSLILSLNGEQVESVWLSELTDENGLTLRAPEYAGDYEVSLRYKDEQGETRIEQIGTLNVGVKPAPGFVINSGELALTVPSEGAGLETVTLRAPDVYTGLLIQWSATPYDVDAPADAWVPNDVAGHPIQGELEPGIWDVLGEAGDTVFSGKIEVLPGRKNNFVIPYSKELSPAGEDEIAATVFPYEGFEGFICEQKTPCRIADAETGLTYTVPAGWAAEKPYFYATAAGVKSELPATEFYGPNSGDEPIVINPFRWMVGNSECIQLRIGVICRYDPAPQDVMDAFTMLAQTTTWSGSDPVPNLTSDDISEMLSKASSQ